MTYQFAYRQRGSPPKPAVSGLLPLLVEANRDPEDWCAQYKAAPLSPPGKRAKDAAHTSSSKKVFFGHTQDPLKRAYKKSVCLVSY